MVFIQSYYQVLNVPVNASLEEIKAAFRKLSLIHHPDKNHNSPESNTRFVFILNAYKILADSVKRQAYDIYLQNSPVYANWKKNPAYAKTALPGRAGEIYRSNEALLNHFNFLLWDIEDFIRDKKEAAWNRTCGKLTVQQYLLKILTFIDKWVLEPAGYPDYFMQARKMKRLDPRTYVHGIGQGCNNSGYSPYVSVTDYFFDIRKRINQMLEKTKNHDLVQPVAEHNLRLIDCIIEAQNLTVHYLSYLLRLESGDIKDIPPFVHSHSCFEV